MAKSISIYRLQTDPSLAQAYLDHEIDRRLANDDSPDHALDVADALGLCERIINESSKTKSGERERFLTVLRLRFLEGATLEELGAALNLTRERARQIEQRLLFLLRREIQAREAETEIRHCHTFDPTGIGYSEGRANRTPMLNPLL